MKILTKTVLSFLQLILFLLVIRLYESNIHRGNLIKRVHLDSHIRFLESIISEGDEEESSEAGSNLPIITVPVEEQTTPTSNNNSCCRTNYTYINNNPCNSNYNNYRQ